MRRLTGCRCRKQRRFTTEALSISKRHVVNVQSRRNKSWVEGIKDAKAVGGGRDGGTARWRRQRQGGATSCRASAKRAAGMRHGHSKAAAHFIRSHREAGEQQHLCDLTCGITPVYTIGGAALWPAHTHFHDRDLYVIREPSSVV
jgi:hypothetical protein